MEVAVDEKGFGGFGGRDLGFDEGAGMMKLLPEARVMLF